MKTIAFCLALLALALLASATASAAPPSPRAKAERTVYTSPSGVVNTNAVLVTWSFAGASQGFAIERRLFPWGWRHVGQSRDPMWIDTRPSKRASWYRVRAMFGDGGKSPWSPKAYAPPVTP